MAEKEQLELNTLAEYVERIFTEHFEGGQISMKAERTLAVQIPAELFERLKEYLAARNLKQKQFLIQLIENALDEETKAEYHYTLSGIKSRTVGDGQHGTARWAIDKEIKQTYAHVPFKVKDWRKGVSLPTEQGLVLGCNGKKDELTALVDGDDIHCLMIAASGAGKTAFFLYPNLEYACASGMSFLALDTKGDLARNYGSIAKKYYGYKHISVIDLRNPTRSDGNNLLTLINRYMDIARKQPDNLAARAKAEKYAKILAKSIVSPEGNSDHGQNAFFYADQNALTRAIVRKYPPKLTEQKTTRSVKGEGQLHDAPVQEMVVAEDIDYDRMPHKRTPYNLPRQEVDR